MKRILAAVALLAACGGSYKAPPSVPSVAMPSGAALKPFDPTKPGLARPSGMELMNGKAWVVLGNYDKDYAVRGPGLLAAFAPSTGQVTVIDLGGTGEQQCLNPGFVRAGGSKLYVACAGDYGNNGAGSALVEVDPNTAQVTRRVSTAVPVQGAAAGSSKLWFGDSGSGNVYAVDLATFALSSTPHPVSCPTGNYAAVSDLTVFNGDLLVVCTNGSGGVMSRLDQSTGALRDTVDVGPIAVELTATGDGRIAIVSGLDQTLRLVTIGKSAMTSQVALTFKSPTSTLQDVRARDQYLYTAASGSNTVQKIDLNAKGGPAVVAEANVGTGATPWNILPLDDDQAIVSNQGSSTVVAVGCPGSGCLQWNKVQ